MYSHTLGFPNKFVACLDTDFFTDIVLYGFSRIIDFSVYTLASDSLCMTQG